MKAHEIMKKDVITVNESATVRDVIEKFINHQISGLPIVNYDNEVIAYISDGDIMRRIGKHKDYIIDMYSYVNVVAGDNEDYEQRIQNILGKNVLEVAKKKFAKVDRDEEVENIAAILGKKQIKKLPVEENGKLVGIISRGDVVRHSFKAMM